MVASSSVLHVSASVQKPSISPDFQHLKTSLSATVKPLLKELEKIPMKIDVNKIIKTTCHRILDIFVDSAFQFVDQPTLPSQRNFAPCEEIGEAVEVANIEGEIPQDFVEGVYIRNGPNPLFGGLKSTASMFGKSSSTWIEGEGMLHAVYFNKDKQGKWVISYKNKYIKSKTFKIEKERNKPSFLPSIEGDSLAILAAFLLNKLRFDEVNKYISNTNVFKHGGRLYAIAENHLPQEIDILSLETFDDWNVDGAWDRAFTSHPKKTPSTGELVMMGVDGTKPFFVLGVVSADGKELVHKVDLKFKRSIICHDIGVTQKYNIIMDFPLIVDIDRLVKGGPLIKYEKDGYARIGVMPRFGDAESIKWFKVEPNCTFHVLNCFEEGGEVVVRGCRALGSIIPGPDHGFNKLEWFSRGFRHPDGLFFSRCYEWRLNMETDAVIERNLSGIDYSMDFPMVNEKFIGLKNKYGYTQVIDSMASSNCGMAKYGMLAKLCFVEVDEKVITKSEELMKVEYHRLEENQFCSGAAFVAKPGNDHEEEEEDDGWVIAFVHNEDTDLSQVHIIDAKRFTSEAVAKIILPRRVPYGFHGAFFSTPCNQLQHISTGLPTKL